MLSQILIGRVIEVLKTLSEAEHLRITVKEVTKGGIIAGAGTIIVGSLVGPIGLFIGGAVGGAIAYFTCDEFQPLSTVIEELSDDEKEKLAAKVINEIISVRPGDVEMLLGVVFSDGYLRCRVLNTLMSSFNAKSG